MAEEPSGTTTGRVLLIAVAVVLMVSGHWMISEAVTFTHMLFEKIPSLLGSG